MMTRSRILASLAPLALLLGCGPAPDRGIAGVPVASHASNFSSWSEPVSLGPTINSSFNDQQASLSKEGLSLYFASNRPGTPGPGPNDIWVSQRDCLACPWKEPANLGAPVNTEFNDASPAVSRDGHWLFFLTNRPAGGWGSSDIWASWRENVNDDFAWQTPVNLGPGVNTSGFDGGPTYLEGADGGAPRLYFNRNAAPAPGGGDIYVSKQAPDGSFGTAVPVAELNSVSTDQRPSILHNGLDIYFFSDRTGSGLNDIWSSTRESAVLGWSPPTNLGTPINTAAPELHPFIFSHGGIELLFFTRDVGTPPVTDFDLFVSMRTRREGQP